MAETALENVKRTLERRRANIKKGTVNEGARGYQYRKSDIMEELEELSKIKNMNPDISAKKLQSGMVTIRQKTVENVEESRKEIPVQSKNVGKSINLMNISGYKSEEKKIDVNKTYSFTIDYKTMLKLQFTTHSKCIKHHMYTTGNADTIGSLCDSKGNVIEVDDNGKNTNIVTKKLAPNKKYILYITVNSKTKQNLTVVVKEELRKEKSQKKKEIKIAPWLIGYSGQPNTSGGKIVTYSFEEREKLKKIEGVKPIDWYSYENQKEPNDFTRPYLENKPFNIGSYGELTDENKRYWITLGPKVFIPNYPDDGKLVAEEFVEYMGCRVDAVLYNTKEKKYAYIECVYSGNIKAHTYNNGIYQTGVPYPNSVSAKVEPYEVGYVNGSIVEFTGKEPYEGTTIKNGTMSSYILKKLVVYPK